MIGVLGEWPLIIKLCVKNTLARYADQNQYLRG